MFSGIINFTILGIFIKYCDAKNYKNYTLYRGIPDNESQLKFFINLSKDYDVNYWIRPVAMHQAIDFVINPLDKINMLKQASNRGVSLKSVTEDVQTYFDQQTVQTYTRKKIGSMNWNNYYRLNDIHNWIRDMSRKHPTIVKIKTIGTSHENRSIIAVQVNLKQKKSRPVVMIEGGIHAREWISPAMVTFLINQIVHAPSSNDDGLKYIAYNYDWYFVPVMNPDGYEYTHTKDRLWRKNRKGPGIDLNRNFDLNFGTSSADMFPNGETYCGQHPFSEKETQAMKSLVEMKSKNLRYYISFHSYGQYIILPSPKSTYYNSNRKLQEMCERAARQIYRRYRTRYYVGTTLATVGYEAAGVSAFWVKRAFDIPYSVVFELRDKGLYGFGLPPKLIQPTCIEILDGLKSLLKPHVGYSEQSSTQLQNKLNPIVISLNLLLFIIMLSV